MFAWKQLRNTAVNVTSAFENPSVITLRIFAFSSDLFTEMMVQSISLTLFGYSDTHIQIFVNRGCWVNIGQENKMLPQHQFNSNNQDCNQLGWSTELGNILDQRYNPTSLDTIQNICLFLGPFCRDFSSIS